MSLKHIHKTMDKLAFDTNLLEIGSNFICQYLLYYVI